MQFPAIYQSEDALSNTRIAYNNWLAQISRLDTSELYKILRQHTHPSLAYQGLNDLELQKRYGELLQRCVISFAPCKPKPRPNRIGVVSTNLKASSAAAWVLEWMKLLPDADWYTYQVGRIVPDPVTQAFKAYSKYRVLPNRVSTAANTIAGDGCCALIYPDVGFSPVIALLASLRLAPVQCAGWGHPATTGIPTIDYFLSSEAYEPETAELHYSEQLIRLPGIGMPLPAIPRVERDKEYFNLNRHTVFLMVQNPRKYLPQYDWIYQEIAGKVRNPMFVFMHYPGSGSRQLIQRLVVPSRLFAWMRRDEFWKLIASGDVFLDPPGWSGANTTHEAISQGTPIVTLPGEFMRGRVSWGMLWETVNAQADHSKFCFPASPTGYPVAALQALDSKRTPAYLPYYGRAIAQMLREVLL